MEGKEDAALSSNSGHIEVAANSGDGSPTPMKGFEDVPETDVNDPLVSQALQSPRCNAFLIVE